MVALVRKTPDVFGERATASLTRTRKNYNNSGFFLSHMARRHIPILIHQYSTIDLISHGGGSSSGDMSHGENTWNVCIKKKKKKRQEGANERRGAGSPCFNFLSYINTRLMFRHRRLAGGLTNREATFFAEALFLKLPRKGGG